MLLKNIILRKSEDFEAAIQDWSDANGISHEVFDGSKELYELADAIVLFHEDYNISRENAAIKDLFANNAKFSHSIDVNGTLMASVSSFVFWLENHKPKTVLVIGDNKLTENKKFKIYLERLAERVK